MSEDEQRQAPEQPLPDFADRILQEWAAEDEAARKQIALLNWGEYNYIQYARRQADAERFFDEHAVTAIAGPGAQRSRDSLLRREFIERHSNRWRIAFPAFQLAQQLVEATDKHGEEYAMDFAAGQSPRVIASAVLPRSEARRAIELATSVALGAHEPPPPNLSKWQRIKDWWNYIGGHGVLYNGFIIIVGIILVATIGFSISEYRFLRPATTAPVNR